jgi:hypothetical protein
LEGNEETAGDRPDMLACRHPSRQPRSILMAKYADGTRAIQATRSIGNTTLTGRRIAQWTARRRCAGERRGGRNTREHAGRDTRDGNHPGHHAGRSHVIDSNPAHVEARDVARSTVTILIYS